MPSEEKIREEITRVMDENPYELGRLRIAFTLQGLTITHDPYEEMSEGGYLTFSQQTSKAVGHQYKTFPYDNRYEIVDEARAHGFDDAMVFNSKNNVTEAGISNLLFLFGDTWFTPPISAGILPGVMRAIAIERCNVEVRNIHISEIPDATEVFLLSSLKIAQPVIQIGEHRLACGELSQAFQREMREKVEYFSVG
jgi:branched-subunit amino acid aminotransferase/4-amino-4-deoxychorismate lyase